jgi:hypothetical protein
MAGQGKAGRVSEPGPLARAPRPEANHSLIFSNSTSKVRVAFGGTFPLASSL